MPLPAEYRGPAGVTVCYFLVYYAFMLLQLSTRSAAVARASRRSGRAVPLEKSVPLDNGAVMGERTLLNTLEQQGAFLAALWSCAACVSCELATVLGSIGLCARLLFPLFWSMGPAGAWNIRVELSTQPYYCCVLGMLGCVGIWAASGVNVAVELPAWALVLTVLASYVVLFAAAFGLSPPPGWHEWPGGPGATVQSSPGCHPMPCCRDALSPCPCSRAPRRQAASLALVPPRRPAAASAHSGRVRAPGRGVERQCVAPFGLAPSLVLRRRTECRQLQRGTDIAPDESLISDPPPRPNRERLARPYICPAKAPSTQPSTRASAEGRSTAPSLAAA